jgi:hypothetical protein
MKSILNGSDGPTTGTIVVLAIDAANFVTDKCKADILIEFAQVILWN